jgi:SulP family sulfate permease
MAERHAVAALIRERRGDALVLLATFLLVLFRDLIEGILAGCALAFALFIWRKR